MEGQALRAQLGIHEVSFSKSLSGEYHRFFVCGRWIVQRSGEGLDFRE